MITVKNISEGEILKVFKILPESKKMEVIDFLSFLAEKTKQENHEDVKKAVGAVEKTWSSIRLNKEILEHIAEDKEIEYEV